MSVLTEPTLDAARHAFKAPRFSCRSRGWMAALHLFQMLWPSFSRYRMMESVNKDDAQQDGKIKEANFNLGAVFGGKKQNRESLRLG